MNTAIKQVASSAMPWLRPAVRDVRGRINSVRIKVSQRDGPEFHCPICAYCGPFVDHPQKDHNIRFTQCPRCENFERHRLQHLVLENLALSMDFSRMSILHFAPEPALCRYFSKRFARHTTADLFADGVDHREDIRAMSFKDASFDLVYASHVLEHVDDDSAAIAEIRRVLKPGGIAILPVPVVSPQTIEYGEANPHEFGHVRAVGTDYFSRYESAFSKVKIWDSSQFPEHHQLYTYESREQYPTEQSPLRVSMAGARHADYVPVCYT